MNADIVHCKVNNLFFHAGLAGTIRLVGLESRKHDGQ